MMPQYTEQFEDADTDYLDDFEEDDDNDDDEELLESFYEEDDDDDDDEEEEGFDEQEGFDDDDGDDESLAERRRRGSYRRSRRRFPIFRRRRYRRSYRRPRTYRSVRSIRRASIRTPAGTMRIRLPKAVATRASVNSRFKEVKREVGRNTKSIKRVDDTLEKNTSIVDKKVNAVRSDLRRSNKKMRDRLQQATLMPLLLQSKPKLDTVTLQEVNADGTTGPLTNHKVTNHEFQSDSNNLLPLMMMMGGMGGGGGSSNMMMMMLAMSGGFGN